MNGTIVITLLVALASLAIAWLALAALRDLRAGPSEHESLSPDRERIGFAVRPT